LSYRVAVRALCEFTAKTGDLDLRFTPSPSAQEGIAGHGTVAKRRGAGYESEIPLQGDYDALQVRGRADGYDPARNQLEEVKTYRGDLSRMPDNQRQLHWAQAKVYGWLLCRERQLSGIDLALVYFNIVSQTETVLVEHFSAEVLRRFFESQCRIFVDWAEQELVHQSSRSKALVAMTFPHGDFRAGQRSLAEAVYKSAGVGCALLAQAPTGIGKTIGTLFPLLKAMPIQRLDRLFYLAAKTPGRRLALDALQRLREQMPDLRVLELVARDKACEYPDRACNGESCPLARGFYDRLPAAREAALQGQLLDRAGVRKVALAHDICPYYLSQELARWADVVVGDYNYYFDTSAMLYALALGNQWRVGVLVDEAHNLVERARSMYTAELDQRTFRAVRKAAPETLRKSFDRINRQWNSLNKSFSQSQAQAYQVQPRLPLALLAALQGAVGAITDYLTENPSADPALQSFHFDALHFGRIAALAEAPAIAGEQDAETDRENQGSLQPDFICDLTRLSDRGDRGDRTGRGATSVICLRNLVPARFLRPRFDAAQSSVMFSATLTPRHYYSDLLGLPERTAWLEVESPFQAEQLSVRIIDGVSTRFRDRGTSVQPIVTLMAHQYAAQPGNYLAFFSSFDYLEQVLARFRAEFPGIPVTEQARRMDEPARQAFLDQFDPGARQIGFAVLGGAFAEGVDLPGDRLVGAFIATLGLPQLNAVNEQLRQRMGTLFGKGYDYAYLYPGLRKVVQAAGRVIRTTSDRGVVYLIDDRFAQPQVRKLLPGWWQPQIGQVSGSHSTRNTRSSRPAETGQKRQDPGQQHG